MRHDLAIVVASALFVMGSQTCVAADSGSSAQGSQDFQNQPSVQAGVGSMDAVNIDASSQFDLKLLAAGMASQPPLVAKSNEKDKDKDKDKDKNKNKDKDKDKNHYPGDWNPDHHHGRGCDNGGDTGTDNTPSSPTPEPGTLLLTGLVAASAGLRARRARKST